MTPDNRALWELVEKCCTDLLGLVEGLPFYDWRTVEGMRLKDTDEWVSFYCAVKRLRDIDKSERSDVWVVQDETGQPVYCASFSEACHDHINDAINEHGIEEAGSWKVLHYANEAILERPVVVGDVPAKVCSWHQCDDEGGSWDTGCGHTFQFTAEGPEENSFTHCCFCGGTLDENPWVASEDESDESMVRGKS